MKKKIFFQTDVIFSETTSNSSPVAQRNSETKLQTKAEKEEPVS